MAVKRFKSNLSISGINDLIKEVERYKNSLEYKARLLAETLSERGVEIARVNIANYDAIFTGELIQSIHKEYKSSLKNGAIFVIKADSEHAVYVEFGTGQMGEEAGYPYPLPTGINWQYNSGKTIFQLDTGEYGWFYPGDDGNWYFTMGMPSRPFMYETSKELQLEVVKIATQIFKR